MLTYQSVLQTTLCPLYKILCSRIKWLRVGRRKKARQRETGRERRCEDREWQQDYKETKKEEDYDKAKINALPKKQTNW